MNYALCIMNCNRYSPSSLHGLADALVEVVEGLLGVDDETVGTIRAHEDGTIRAVAHTIAKSQPGTEGHGQFLRMRR